MMKSDMEFLKKKMSVITSKIKLAVYSQKGKEVAMPVTVASSPPSQIVKVTTLKSQYQAIGDINHTTKATCNTTTCDINT